MEEQALMHIAFMYLTTGIHNACSRAISMLEVRCYTVAFTWFKMVISGDLHEVCHTFQEPQLHNALLWVGVGHATYSMVCIECLAQCHTVSLSRFLTVSLPC